MGENRWRDEPPDHFVYDPADPVPTRGGNTLILPMGVQDQRPVEARDDDGFARNLADGIARARYRESREVPRLLAPGEVTAFTVDLWATSHLFLPGHRIRVEISSSNFPRFDRNLNTGEDQATNARWPTARQTVFHDRRYPSCIALPVIPR